MSDQIHFQDLSGQKPKDICRRAVCQYDLLTSFIHCLCGEMIIVYFRISKGSVASIRTRDAFMIIFAFVVGICERLGRVHITERKGASI